ncbi:MAG: sulfate permease [Paludibacter sp.]|nr:sulfate permease [Bacteroidales bacterium]MCM1069482.1 sulfate permease [Prevotella sp.]MCM1354138.1 sulfate permease [Bacteroides sp.]MCM1443005.1 sulfate permease [Muribaculum sp.]MCM1482213.1 sulfate permease [Paludibacter sp.]
MKGISGFFQPKFFSLFKKGNYDKQTFVSDLIAGIIVGIIALPLAIAFGIASGVSPQQGLITAIVAGFLVSLFGGSRFLIGGPTGAFIVIVAGIIAQYGMQGLLIATIMAGIFLIIMGVCKMGIIFKFIPYPIVVGFTSGIALTIFSTQMKDFFGFNMDVPAGFIPEWICYFRNITHINWAETAMSVACLLIIVVWGRYSKKIPGSLIVLIVGTAASVLLHRFAGIDLATIGTKFPELAEGLPMPKPVAPAFDYATIKGLVSPAFTIAILCAIESLLAAMVADGVTGKHHNSNTELIGQGIANIITPLFGGIPATGAIARTMANINNGGKSPVAGIIHAIVLLLIYLFLMPYAVYIPLSCLAAILVMVAYNMSEWRTFKYLLRGDKSDIAVLLITFFLTVLIDLTVAIEVGVVLAIGLFVRRVMQTSSIQVIEEAEVLATENEEVINPDDTEHLDIPEGVEIYEINGPFFFGLASKFEELDKNRKAGVKVRIIRMRKVPFIDSTGINNLHNLCERTHKRGIQVILSGVNDEVRTSLLKFGMDKEIGEEFIQPHIIPALEKAKEVLAKQ